MRKAFTLIELLVVIAIIATLAVMVFLEPSGSFSNSKEFVKAPGLRADEARAPTPGTIGFTEREMRSHDFAIERIASSAGSSGLMEPRKAVGLDIGKEKELCIGRKDLPAKCRGPIQEKWKLTESIHQTKSACSLSDTPYGKNREGWQKMELQPLLRILPSTPYCETWKNQEGGEAIFLMTGATALNVSGSTSECPNLGSNESVRLFKKACSKPTASFSKLLFGVISSGVPLIGSLGLGGTLPRVRRRNPNPRPFRQYRQDATARVKKGLNQFWNVVLAWACQNQSSKVPLDQQPEHQLNKLSEAYYEVLPAALSAFEFYDGFDFAVQVDGAIYPGYFIETSVDGLRVQFDVVMIESESVVLCVGAWYTTNPTTDEFLPMTDVAVGDILRASDVRDYLMNAA